MIEITQHAQSRIRQRAIPPSVIEWLIDYGSSVNGDNCEIIYFDKKAKKMLSKELGKEIVKCISKFLNTYIVLSKDGAVITAGYRYKKLPKDTDKSL